MGTVERGGGLILWGGASKAEPLVDDFIEYASRLGIIVESGTFGAHMDVTLCNDGPVTLILDSP